MAWVRGIGESLITDLYEQNRTANTDISEHLETFVELCEQLQARRVIELGVRSGVSTSAWLYALEQTDNGHLWSVDIDAAPDIESDRWTFVRADDTDPTVVAGLPSAVDVVFIDTNHQYEHTLRELALYLPKVRAGGRIVLHDTEVERPDGTTDTDFPVKRAVDLFCTANGLSWSNRTNNNGLGIVEV